MANLDINNTFKTKIDLEFVDDKLVNIEYEKENFKYDL